MKVLDLQCQYAHSFEGWFGSEDDFQSQLARGLVECPMCGDDTITKKLSAPRLNLSGYRDVAVTEDAISSVAAQADNTSITTPSAINTGSANHAVQAVMQDPQFQAAYLKMARKLLANTEDVGSQFPQEARKIHYGDTPVRAIRGQATRDETLELLDEGIDVMPLPLPKVFKEPLQ
jgi:hypothetical protein